MNRRTAVHLAGPVLALTVLGGVFLVDAHRQSEVAEAHQQILEDQQPFRDPAVIQQARQVAFTNTARARAPFIARGLTDTALVEVAQGICGELTSGVASPDLSIRDEYDDAPLGEVSAVIGAAHGAYCPEASLSGSLSFEVVQ